MASEVTFDLGNQLRDLDYLCYNAYFLSLSLKSLFSPRRKEEETSYLAAGKKSIWIEYGFKITIYVSSIPGSEPPGFGQGSELHSING